MDNVSFAKGLLCGAGLACVVLVPFILGML